MTAKEEKKELQDKYREVLGKNPAPSFDIAELKRRIEEKEKEDKQEIKKAEKSGGDPTVFKGIKIDPTKNYEFRLKKRSNPRSLLPREASVWDEDTQTSRTIRLCSIEESPYLDEQNKESKMDSTAPVFTDGVLNISGVHSNRIKFLLAFDGYDKKKTIMPNNEWIRGMYELVDPEKISANNLSEEEAKQDAKQLIRNADKEELHNFMRSAFLLGVDSMSDDDIKTNAYLNAETAPYVFLNEFTNPIHAVKASVQKLFGKGELTDDNGSIKWKDTGGLIASYDDTKERADDVLAKMVLLGEKQGKEFKERMDSKLK